MEYDAKKWANAFIKELKQITDPNLHSEKRKETSLDLLNYFDKAGKKAFFLDYDGTLREFEDHPDKAGPTREIQNLLKQLCARKDMELYIVSGRTPADLEKWFGKMPITLIGEHGYRYRIPGKDWTLLSNAVDTSWKETVMPMLEQFVASTPGSFIEEKQSAIVWHYRLSDPEFGKWKSKQLMGTLYEFLANAPVEVHHGKKMVEITSIQVNKGAALQYFCEKKKYDFILCAGDDQTDESMFRIQEKNIFSIKVGKGESQAKYHVEKPSAFRELLSVLINK